MPSVNIFVKGQTLSDHNNTNNADNNNSNTQHNSSPDHHHQISSATTIQEQQQNGNKRKNQHTAKRKASKKQIRVILHSDAEIKRLYELDKLNPFVNATIEVTYYEWFKVYILYLSIQEQTTILFNNNNNQLL